MRAAVLRSIDSGLKIEELNDPKPKDNEVLIKVNAVGLCHTDLHVLRGHIPFPLPAVLGHEVSGIVESVGNGVDNVQRGDRVVGPFILPCGKCRLCIRGYEDLCENFYNYNRLRGVYYDGTSRLTAKDGSTVYMYSMAAHAEYSVIPATSVFKVPDTMNLDDASILGCAIMTAYGACRNASLKPAEQVAVFGIGGVGSNVVQIASKVFNTDVIAIDIRDEKLEYAKSLGAKHTINSKKDDPVKAIMDITDGRGVDAAIEVIGMKETISTAIRSVRSGGRAVLVGLSSKGNEAGFEINFLVRKGVHIIGSYGGKPRVDMPEIIALASKGIIDVANVISERFRLEEVNEAFEKLEKGGIRGRAVIKVSQ
ncbi:MAG: zinc-binding dehydrogenase [Candidatus Nitrosocaldus sp.]